MKSILLFLLFISLGITGRAQHSSLNKPAKSFQLYLDSLKALSHQAINNPNEPERYNANYAMIKTLVSTLKLPNSFNLNFDSLKTISVMTSQDRRFKIFTWHVMNQDGSYRYYGTIQMNAPSGKLQLFPLVDHSHAYSNPQDTVTTNADWYGSQYYKIVPVLNNVRTPYYILLGWKGNTVKSTKKVIDVLYFKDGKAYFGMPVFDGNPEASNKKRIVFEYNRQVSLLLNYTPAEGTIVFDHLAPPDPKMTERYDLYGPDMSYDGYKLANGRWKYIEDLQLKNSPSAIDQDFNDPTKPSKKVSTKIIQ